jgi:hypothetical protein
MWRARTIIPRSLNMVTANFFSAKVTSGGSVMRLPFRRSFLSQARKSPKSAPVEGEHELFGFLTTEANAIVAPIHPKAMPVIVTTTEEFDLWLEGETVEA